LTTALTAPPAIGGTTPAAGAFTTLTSSGLHTASGGISVAASQGIVITAGAPGTTAQTLYAVGSALYWNGTALGTVNLASPGPIGGTTPSTGTFTTLQARTVGVGAAPLAWAGGANGWYTIDVIGNTGENLSLAYQSGQGSGLCYNYYDNGTTNGYTISDYATVIFMHSGTIQLGVAPSGTAGAAATFKYVTVNNDGSLSIATNITSTSTTTGSLKVAGGLGVTGAFYGTTITASGTIQANANIQFASETISNVAGSMYRNSGSGIIIWAVTGTSTDFQLSANAGTAVMTVPTGKSYPNFPNSGTYTGTWGTGSDIQLKADVESIKDALATVMAIDTITFRWNELAENKDKTSRFHGVSAQSVQKVAPDFVMEGVDGYLAVDYGKLATLALAAIKEQQIQIDELKRLIA
jgi:hypothetical protein